MTVRVLPAALDGRFNLGQYYKRRKSFQYCVIWLLYFQGMEAPVCVKKPLAPFSKEKRCCFTIETFHVPYS